MLLSRATHPSFVPSGILLILTACLFCHASASSCSGLQVLNATRGDTLTLESYVQDEEYVCSWSIHSRPGTYIRVVFVQLDISHEVCQTGDSGEVWCDPICSADMVFFDGPSATSPVLSYVCAPEFMHAMPTLESTGNSMFVQYPTADVGIALAIVSEVIPTGWCSGLKVLNATRGGILTLGDSANKVMQLACSWSIQSRPGTYIRVQEIEFFVYYFSPPPPSELHFYDGDGSEDNVLASIGGTFESTGNRLFVDYSAEVPDFNFRAKFSEVPEIGWCSGLQVLNATKGATLSSGDSALDHNPRRCSWSIYSRPGTFIRVQTTSFDVFRSTNGEEIVYYDGPTTDSPIIAYIRACLSPDCNPRPPIIKSTGNRMFVTLYEWTIPCFTIRASISEVVAATVTPRAVLSPTRSLKKTSPVTPKRTTSVKRSSLPTEKRTPSRPSPSVKRSPSLKRNPSLNRSPSIKRSPSLKRNPSLNRSPSIKRSPSLKQNPSLNRSPSIKRSPSVKQSPSVKRSPSVNRSASIKRSPRLLSAKPVQN